jgi:hypothetical protein
MRRNYNDWMAESVKELTPAGKIKRPSYETVVNWVNASWNAIDSNLIQRSFKCCGVSNNRDGTEDNLIFDFKFLEKPNQLDDGIEIQENIREGNVEEDLYYEGSSYDNVWDN